MAMNIPYGTGPAKDYDDPYAESAKRLYQQEAPIPEKIWNSLNKWNGVVPTMMADKHPSEFMQSMYDAVAQRIFATKTYEASDGGALTGFSAQMAVVDETDFYETDWETEAQNTAAALAQANAKIVALTAEVEELRAAAAKTAGPKPRSNSDVLGACMKADRTLDGYGR